MKVLTSALVSNSEMIRNYKTCRDKAEELGKIFIMKNNQVDAVLFSVAEYERLSDIIGISGEFRGAGFPKGYRIFSQEGN